MTSEKCFATQAIDMHLPAGDLEGWVQVMVVVSRFDLFVRWALSTSCGSGSVFDLIKQCAKRSRNSS